MVEVEEVNGVSMGSAATSRFGQEPELLSQAHLCRKKSKAAIPPAMMSVKMESDMVRTCIRDPYRRTIRLETG